MEPSNWTTGSIAIKDLLLWDENPRFPQEYFNKNTEELIDYYLSKEDLNIVDFAKEIVKDFDLPQLEKLVVLDIKGKKVVLEGNRRLATYKLIANPSLAKHKDINKTFGELQKLISINNSFELEANVTSNKNEGLRYVERKHSRNNNEVAWREPERRHFAVRSNKGNIKDIVRVELANAVKNLSIPDVIKESILGKGYVTTFYRIADSAAARTKLGYKLDDDGKLNIKDQQKFNDLLKVLAYNVWAKKDFQDNVVDSRNLNKIDDINDYINKLKQIDTKLVDEELEKRQETDLFGEQTIKTGSRVRSRQLSEKRNFLIKTSIYIKDGRINSIYNELKKKIKVDEAPNAVAALFRVFLECSVDCYIEDNKIEVKSDTKLAGKILKTVEHLEDSLAREHLTRQGVVHPNDDEIKSAKEKVKLKSARRLATKDNNSILSVSTFHDFVHDYKSAPVPTELKTHWDNLDGFFVALWRSLQNKDRA